MSLWYRRGWKKSIKKLKRTDFIEILNRKFDNFLKVVISKITKIGQSRKFGLYNEKRPRRGGFNKWCEL